MGGSSTIAFVDTTNANALAFAPVGTTHLVEPCLHCLAFALAFVFSPYLCLSYPLDLAHVFAFIFAFALVASWLPRVGHGDAILDHGMEVEIGRGIDGGIEERAKTDNMDTIHNYH